MSSCVDAALDTGEKVGPSWGVGLRGTFGGDRGRMSKKGRANRTSGAPKSSPSVRALSSASDAPPSSKKAAVAEKAVDAKAEPKSPESKPEKIVSSDDALEAKGSAPANEPGTESSSSETTSDTKATSDEAGANAEARPSTEPTKSDSVSAPPEALAQETKRSSQPPAKELDDESFFAEGTRRSSMPPPIEGDSADARTVRLLEDPEVLARRAKSVTLVRYVVGAFALLLAVGVVAKLREAPPPKPPAPVFVHSEGTSASSAETGQVKPSNSAETTSAAAPSASAIAPDASLADSGVGESGALDSGAVDSGATTTSTSDAAGLAEGGAGTTLATDAGLDAKALKRACQRALDGGKLAQAIESGEASVAADPTDGEAWLLLGAAYDQKGRAADARTAYQSCVQKGKRGPVGECAALLR